MSRVDSQFDGAAVRLCAIREDLLSLDEVLAAVADPSCGAQVLFLGRVRDHDHDRTVESLAYQAHPQALERMQQVCMQVAAEFGATAVAAVHRVGSLEIGDIAVVTAAAAPHRDVAFAAGSALIDRLKSATPIWKNQHFADGDSEWVGLP